MTSRLCSLLGLSLLLAACDDLTFGSSVGGVTDTTPSAASSVKAVGLLLQRAAPGGLHLLEAQLQLVDPSDLTRTVPVGDLKLLVDGTPVTLFAVSPNFYQSATTVDFGTLAPGTPVQFSLVAALPTGAKRLSANLELPAAPALRLPATAEPAGAGRATAFELPPLAEGGLLLVSPVSGWGSVVTYDLLADAAAGADASGRIDRWLAAVSAFTGPDESIPAAAFPQSGAYWVEVAALSRVSGSALTTEGWGAGSWFAAGNAAAAELEAP